MNNGDNDGEAFTYAYNNVNDYAGNALYPEVSVNQQPEMSDNFYIT